jgi:hypothetical protein
MTAAPIPVPVTRSGWAGTDTMRAAVFEGPDRITLQERPVPACGATRFTLDQIEEAYDLFANQRDGVAKVAITP